MAQPPKEIVNEAFYREVDDELRRAQMVGFFRRFGPWIGAFVALLLIAVGGYIYWEHRSRVASERQTEQLEAIFDDINAGKVKAAEPRLDTLAEEGDAGYSAAALLTKADLAVRAGNDTAAADAFRKVAENEDVPAPYREAALIRQTAIEYDKLPPEKVIERLKPLAVKGNPWFGSAGEMVAIAHVKQRRTDLAAPILAAIAKDEDVPETIRLRAVQIAGALGADVLPAEGANKGSTR